VCVGVCASLASNSRHATKKTNRRRALCCTADAGARIRANMMKMMMMMMMLEVKGRMEVEVDKTNGGGMRCYAVRWEHVEKKKNLGEDQVFVFLGEQDCKPVYTRSLEEKEGASFSSDGLLRPDLRWKE